MRSRRLPLGLIVPAALGVLVALLATLQYKWLGQVSEAERDRRRTTLHQNAEDFANDFDRELTLVYQSLQVDGGPLLQGDWTAFATRYDLWRGRAKDPQIVKAVYLATSGESENEFFEYRPDRGAFDKTAWPASLARVQASLTANRERVDVMGSPALPGSAAGSWVSTVGVATQTVLAFKHTAFADIPAIVIMAPVIHTTDFPLGMTGALRAMTVQNLDAGKKSASIIVELDREYIRSTLLPALVTRYFPHDVDQFRFAVVEGGNAATPVFSRGLAESARLDPERADTSVSLFSIRPELAAQFVFRASPEVKGQPLTDRTFTLETRSVGIAPAAAATPTLTPPAPVPPASALMRSTSSNVSIFLGSGDGMKASAPRGAWQLVVQHTAGSLDAAVNQARRRNLWLSFGILSVLAAGVALMVVNAERSRKLAVQQMDFVATVSHELRTPLAVIRSAAQNLSAGVVSDPVQAKRYGDLIESEGRRLTDMVEQVLEFAGLSGNRTLARAQPLDVGAIARDVVETSAALFEGEHVEVEVQVADDLPPVLADEGAVRRALNNLLTNALKYGADGRWIGVSARRAGIAGSGSDEVQLSVSDRGRGIEATDLPHIFDAFYRGRYAVDRQIHGNGLGLSLVKRIAEAHGGKVTVSSVPGQGATFTIHLPAAAADPSTVQPHADPLAASGTPTA